MKDPTDISRTASSADVSGRSTVEGQPKASLSELGEFKTALDEHAIVAITDPQGRITCVNDKFCAISKYSREELIGQDHRIINSGHHSREFIRDLWTAIAQGRVWHGEIKNKAKDGACYWVDATIVPFLDAQGKPRQYVTIQVDVTERKRAEEQMRREKLELEERLRKRTVQMEVANKEFQAFSYSISHDLRAPLRAMNGFAAMLQKSCGPALSQEGMNYLDRIQANAARLGELIEGLLNFSNLSWLPVTRIKADLGEIVRTALDDLRAEIDGRRVEFQIGDLPSCDADAMLLRQVFTNLLSNSIKYSKHRDPAVIQVGSQIEGGQCVYFIKDNGAGFDMRYAERLFGVFQRLHRVEEFEGAGVGLAVAQRIIQRHGGRIWAAAEVDQGATFHFTIGEDKPEDMAAADSINKHPKPR